LESTRGSGGKLSKLRSPCPPGGEPENQGLVEMVGTNDLIRWLTSFVFYYIPAIAGINGENWYICFIFNNIPDF
jgi:hypothetical protein